MKSTFYVSVGVILALLIASIPTVPSAFASSDADSGNDNDENENNGNGNDENENNGNGNDENENNGNGNNNKGDLISQLCRFINDNRALAQIAALALGYPDVGTAANTLCSFSN